MRKEAKRARFDAMGGRTGIAERILEVAKQIVEVDSYKRAVIGAGQIRLLAELCDSDDYWSEKASYGHQVESDIANGCRTCTFDVLGSIKWDELKKESDER
jgi:hypothetical protein